MFNEVLKQEISILVDKIYQTRTNIKSLYLYSEFFDYLSKNHNDISELLAKDYSNDDFYEELKVKNNYELFEYIILKDKDMIAEIKRASILSNLIEIENKTFSIDDYIMEQSNFFHHISHTFKENELRSVYFLYLKYQNFCNEKMHMLNSEFDNISLIYSEFAVSKVSNSLIAFVPEIEPLFLNPARIFDKRINKTFILSNVDKDFLSNICSMKCAGYIKTVEFRVKNDFLSIYDGKNTRQLLTEEFEYGKPFNNTRIAEVPVTKLCSENYYDKLWIISDCDNITFEETYDERPTYKNSIVTQMVHLRYKLIDGNVFIVHIDHEFIFYSKDEYKRRMDNAYEKGKQYKRIKSFIINDSLIPFDYKIDRVVINSNDNHLKESVPFIIYVLKKYFKHWDLIDEYFSKLTN